MISIQPIPCYTDVMFAFPPKLRYFAEVEAANGAVVCAFQDAVPVGVVCLRNQTYNIDIAYLYVDEANRRQGIAAALVSHAVRYANDQGTLLCFRVLQNSEYAPACTAIADRLGLHPCGRAMLFSMEVNAASKLLWEEYKPKLADKIARVETKTGKHEVVTFAEAGEAVLGRLREKIGSSLPGYLNPFTLPDLNPMLSVIVLRRGEPVAFHAARTIGEKMICEISSAEKGSTLLPAAPVFFEMLFSSEVKKCTAVVYSDNAAGKNHTKGRLGFLFRESNKQTTYISQ
jgi:GNAT superfamily N-acetyltransferase